MAPRRHKKRGMRQRKESLVRSQAQCAQAERERERERERDPLPRPGGHTLYSSKTILLAPRGLSQTNPHGEMRFLKTSM